MKSADNIKQFFRNAELGINQDADEQVFEDVLRARQKFRESTPAVPVNLWRIIMKSQLAKLAVAAVLVIACVTGVFVFSQTSGAAWAIEQSIEAVSRYKAVIVEGLDSERTWKEDGSAELRPFKAWAVASEDQTMVEKYRHEVDGVPVLTTDGKKTWRYDSQTDTVSIENHPYVASECWCGSRFLEQIKSFLGEVVTDWDVTYGKDPATGERRAFLKIAWLEKRYNGPRSMWLEFDIQSKLPIGFKQWENSNWQGPPTLVVEKITYYQNLPGELFEFEIPDGATEIGP